MAARSRLPPGIRGRPRTPTPTLDVYLRTGNVTMLATVGPANDGVPDHNWDRPRHLLLGAVARPQALLLPDLRGARRRRRRQPTRRLLRRGGCRQPDRNRRRHRLDRRGAHSNRSSGDERHLSQPGRSHDPGVRPIGGTSAGLHVPRLPVAHHRSDRPQCRQSADIQVQARLLAVARRVRRGAVGLRKSRPASAFRCSEMGSRPAPA